MYDDFDEELDKGPEGSILTPIFLGCGAMGLGCLFSVGAIAVALMIFVPNIWNAIVNVADEDALMNATLPYVVVDAQLITALGQPIVGELIDRDVRDEDNLTYELGEELNFITTYRVFGPLGAAIINASGSQVLLQDTGWNIQSITARLDDDTLVHVYPTEVDTPPPPAQLAPPETESAVPDTPGEVPDDMHDDMPDDIRDEVQETELPEAELPAKPIED